MATKIEFPRGDDVTHTFSMPATDWTLGGLLFFTAKPVVDDDNTDANAVIDMNFNDSVVSDVVINGIAYKKYTCHFPPSATNSISSGGADSADYEGEFQWVGADGTVKTFPPNDPKLDCVVYFDIKRKTT